MGFKEDLDRWITREPESDGFDEYCEKITELFSNEFFDSHDEWLVEYDGVFNKWLNKLFDAWCDVEYAAKLIERAAKLYKL